MEAGRRFGSDGEEERAVERLGAANRGATRNIARGPLFHPLKENWQDARFDESAREKNEEKERGLAGYNGTKLLWILEPCRPALVFAIDDLLHRMQILLLINTSASADLSCPSFSLGLSVLRVRLTRRPAVGALTVDWGTRRRRFEWIFESADFVSATEPEIDGRVDTLRGAASLDRIARRKLENCAFATCNSVV